MVVSVSCSSWSAAVLLHPDTYITKHLLCLDNAASLQMFYNHIQGFRQECLRGGIQKGWGVWVSSPRRKKIRVFKFWCLKWPILTEMTVKYWKYFIFFCQQGGISPPVALSGGVRTPTDPPPGGNPGHFILECSYLSTTILKYGLCNK